MNITATYDEAMVKAMIAGALGVSRGTAYDLMREALAEQSAQQEPVKHELLCICGCSWEIDADGNEELVSIPPAQRKPLTEEQINRVWMLNGGGLAANRYHDFARAIEAAHGIKENT